MADFLEAAAVTGKRVAFDCREQFALCKRGLVGAGDEIGERHGAPAARRDELDFCVVGDQAGRDVGGRRSIDDIAADGRLGADLVVGEPHRTARHGGQRASERGIVEETLDRRRGAEPHAAFADLQFVKLGNTRDVDQHRNVDVAGATFARPRQRVGAARDNATAAAVALHRGEGFSERSRRQIFVADEHRFSSFASSWPGLSRPSRLGGHVRP